MQRDLIVIIIGLLIGGVIGGTAFLLLKLRLKRGNQMIRLLEEKKYDQVIMLVKDIPVKKLTAQEKVNLAGAYFRMGNKEKAKEIISAISPKDFAYGALKSTIEDWKEGLK